MQPLEQSPAVTETRPVPGTWRPGRALAPLVLSALASLGVAGLADAAGEHDGPSRMDPVAAADVLRLRTAGLTGLAHALSLLGSEVVVGGVALAVLALLLVPRDFVRAATVALAMGGSAFLTVALKLLVARHRPGQVDRLGALDTSFSFPSGHTLNTAVLLALLVWLLWPGASSVARWFLVLVGTTLAVAVGASRVYLGYHWLTDVLASGLVAVAWLSTIWLLRPLIERAVGAARAMSSSPTPASVRL